MQKLAMALRIHVFLMAKHRTSWHRSFKGLSHRGGQAELSDNLRASPFIKNLSNDYAFNQINLDEQYLK
jgi:hypothetical protein